ncbi:unnamed protein product, partial [Toxocara canis]|uniref:Chloride channel protein n=1 Tax=Toxocara canis TaxID=6265 RepID=A0A183V1J1_TOXCA
IVHNIAQTFHHHHAKDNKRISEFTAEEVSQKNDLAKSSFVHRNPGLHDAAVRRRFVLFQAEKWVKKQLSKQVDFSVIAVDDSPFQLVEQSSLYKVHSLFSLLGVTRAYVTDNGVLVGVVALKEVLYLLRLRMAIELAQAGAVELPPRQSERNWQRNIRAPSIIENLAVDTDTDDEDVISPRAVIKDEHPSPAQLSEEEMRVRSGTETTYYSTEDETDSTGMEQGKSSSRSLSTAMQQPFSETLNDYLQENATANDVQWLHSATEADCCSTTALARVSSAPAEIEGRTGISHDAKVNV